MDTSKINALDEALRLIFLESAKEEGNGIQRKQMALLLPASQLGMSDEKKRLLLQKLGSVAESLSLGRLLQHSMKHSAMNEAVVAHESELPIEVIQDLKGDLVYTNNIPINLFRKLLSILNISFASAESAVRKTFEILQHQVSGRTNSYSGFNPTYRKGHLTSKEELLKNNSRSDGKELFENKEALDKYLLRLNELMNN